MQENLDTHPQAANATSDPIGARIDQPDEEADFADAVPEAEEEEDVDLVPDRAQSGADPGLDPERLFWAGVSGTSLLSREDEEALARRIVSARDRIRGALRRHRSLTQAALAHLTRGVVHPEEDFREQETLVILQYAQAALAQRQPAGAMGLRKRELRAFVVELAAALGEYRVLRNQMLEANLRLVAALARRYRNAHLTFLDLAQEGSIGLLRAIEKYEPSRDVKFGTYATWWIWQRMSRASDTHGSLIRTPVHWNQLQRRLSRHGHGEESPPESEEMTADERDKDEVRLAVAAQGFRYVSTATPLSDGGEETLEAVLASDRPAPEALAFHSDLRAQLEEAIGRLPAREREIIQRRFDLDADGREKLGDIGARFGVSRERIRQLEGRALRLLREICASQGLQEYLH